MFCSQFLLLFCVACVHHHHHCNLHACSSVECAVCVCLVCLASSGRRLCDKTNTTWRKRRGLVHNTHAQMMTFLIAMTHMHNINTRAQCTPVVPSAARRAGLGLYEHKACAQCAIRRRHSLGGRVFVCVCCMCGRTPLHSRIVGRVLYGRVFHGWW